MQSCCRLFFGVFLVLFTAPPLYSQEDPYEDLMWYESFFAPSSEPVDSMLSNREAAIQKATDDLEYADLIRLHKECGLIHLNRTYNYSESLRRFISAMKLEDSLDMRQKEVFTYMGIAAVFEAVGNPAKSAEHLEKAMRLNDQFRNIPVLVSILNRLGNVNAEQGENEAALANFEVALVYSDSISQTQLAGTLYNQANLYGQIGNEKEALEVHKEALKLWRSLNNKSMEAKSLFRIGQLYGQMRNSERELANHVAALDIRRRLDEPSDLAASYNSIGLIHYRKKDYNRSIANLKLGLKYGKEAVMHQEMRTSYEFLGYCYKAIGDFRTALQYTEDFTGLNNLIQQEIDEQRLLEMQNSYAIQQRENQITELEEISAERQREIDAQRVFRNYLILVLFLIVIIGVLVTYLYLQKRKTNKALQEAHDLVKAQNVQLQELIATKDKFFSIISHDIKGPLNSLTSFSSMLVNHYDALTKEEIQMLATDSDKSLKNLFAMLENLLEWARSQTGNIEFNPEAFNVNQLLADNKALLETQAGNKRITILHDPAATLTVWAHKNSVNTVIRNLISNAIKFTRDGGAVSLSATVHNHEIITQISDTGVGMRKEVLDKLFRIDAKHSTKGTADEKGTGLGLILCKDFIEKNGGTIWVESEEGKGSVFSFTLQQPVTKDSVQLPKHE